MTENEKQIHPTPSSSRGRVKGESENPGSDIEHGGNIYRLAEELKMQERTIIDFSASINPLGVSKKIKTELRKQLKYLHNYPDPDARRLRKRLAQHHGIDPEMILCGNGSTELIYLASRALKPKSVLIPAPTFSEYERTILIGQDPATTEQRAQIRYLVLKKEDGFEIRPDEFIQAMQDKDCDMAFICNPNNPTGSLLKKDSVMQIAEAARALKCILVVDEAFIDFCPEDSTINEVKNNPYLIVLRSMTKFYALSGLRLGYGVFPQHLIGRLKEYKEPWTVNNLAQRSGVVVLKDKVYRNETFRIVRYEKQFMEKGFKKLGIDYIPSSVNYYLIRLDNAEEVITSLRNKGILVRECSNFIGLDESYIRVAVKSHKDNARLLKELSLWLKA